MENNKNFNNREGGRLAGGLILVAVGAALLLRNTGFVIPGWMFSWPMILILVGIYSGFKHHFRNNSWLVLIGVGGFFLVNEFIPNLGLEPLFWPLIIIAVGVIFILRPGKNNWLDFKKDIEYNKFKNAPDSDFQATGENIPADSSDYLMVRSVFSGVVKKVVSKNFQGGRYIVFLAVLKLI